MNNCFIDRYYKYGILDGKVYKGKIAIDLWNNGYGTDIFVSNSATEIVNYLIKNNKLPKVQETIYDKSILR